MAISSISICCIVLIFLLSRFEILSADQNSSSSSRNFGKDPIFGSDFGLYGDAEIVDAGFRIRLTNSVSASSGGVMYKKPIKFVQGKPRKFGSFSTQFSFSLSPENGGGLATLVFLLVPRGFNASLLSKSSFGLSLRSKKRKTSFVAVEFGSSRNHLTVNLGRSGKVMRNLSSATLVLNTGVMNCWVDYEASSKRLEIRLSKSGESKPIYPTLSYKIDLSSVWSSEEAFMMLSSSNGNSTQACSIHSWNSKLLTFPNWMHSEPLNPESQHKPLVVKKEEDCFVRVVAALICGTVGGALAASCVLYLWTVFGSRRPVSPEECAVLPPVDLEYNKVKVKAAEKNGRQVGRLM